MEAAGFGTLSALAYPEDTAPLTALPPKHNEVFGYREADDQEPPPRVQERTYEPYWSLSPLLGTSTHRPHEHRIAYPSADN